MQQASILSAIIHESGGDPFAVNKNTGRDYGLLQWVDRYKKSNETNPYKEIDNQLNYLYSTLDNLDDGVSWTHGGKGSGYSSLQDAHADFYGNDLTSVNRGLNLGYIRSSGKHAAANNREMTAKQIYDIINNEKSFLGFKFNSGGKVLKGNTGMVFVNESGDESRPSVDDGLTENVTTGVLRNDYYGNDH